MLLSLMDGIARAIARAATLRQKLQIKLPILLSRNILNHVICLWVSDRQTQPTPTTICQEQRVSDADQHRSTGRTCTDPAPFLPGQYCLGHHPFSSPPSLLHFCSPPSSRFCEGKTPTPCDYQDGLGTGLLLHILNLYCSQVTVITFKSVIVVISHLIDCLNQVSVFSFSSRWHRSARKGPYALCPVSQQSPQGCPRNSASICLVEDRSFSTLEGGMSAASFLHSSFLQAVSAVMFWPVHVQKHSFLQAISALMLWPVHVQKHSFLQAVSVLMLWPVHVQKVPQASEHLCLAKLQTRCDICCACQSICPFILTDSSVPRTVDPQKSL